MALADMTFGVGILDCCNSNILIYRHLTFCSLETATKRWFGCFLLILLLIIFCESKATERVTRKLDESSGPLIAPVFSLAQDTEGFTRRE
jgi:hypothetical protein